MKKDLIARLNEGPVLCAEGYLFAMERRGYLSAGAFVPEVVLKHPEVVSQLHREFIRAGSDVVHRRGGKSGCFRGRSFTGSGLYRTRSPGSPFH